MRETATQDDADIQWALFSLNGRLGNKAYFLGAVLPVLAFIIATISFFQEAADGGLDLVYQGFGGFVLAIAYLALFPLTLWIYIALTVKRLHDLNLSGFFIFIALFPMIAFVAFILLCFLPGTDGVNKFGPVKNSRNDLSEDEIS